MSASPTPGPWSVRTREFDGKVVDCFVTAFVTAPDVNGFPYAAEILGDDEYRGNIQRKLADCRLISAAPELLAALEALIGAMEAEVSTRKCHVNPLRALNTARALLTRLSP